MRYFEDFQIGEVATTKGRTITETDIVLFAAFSGDWHQLHTNEEYAKKGPFGERIAHGYLVLTVASGLMPLEETAIIAFYGMDKLRFLGPTRIGDTIHARIEVMEKEGENENGGIISFEIHIVNQKDKDVAAYVLKLLVGKKK